METAYYNLSGGINQALTKTELGMDTKKMYWADSQNIQIYTGTAMKKSGSSQIQSSPQNCCEVLFLFLSSRSHDNSTGNISGSLFIMSSCICQKKAGWFQMNNRLGCFNIMYNSSMLSIVNNRIKTVIYEILLFRTEFIQLFCCT